MEDSPSAENQPTPSPSSNDSLPDSTTRIESEDKTIIIIGTAHVSQKSVDDVVKTIDLIQPDDVVIELCQARFEALENPDRWKNTNVYNIVKEGKSMLLLSNLLLSSFQKKIGEKLGVKPGAEMLIAIEKARECNANIVLGDRNVQTTLKRTWSGLGMLEKSKLMMTMVQSLFTKQDIDEAQLDQLKDKDTLTEVLKEIGKFYPSISDHLINERDLFLMNSIIQSKGPKVVAVVGAGHVPGIKEHWGEKVDIDELNRIPPPSKWLKGLKWAFPVFIIGVFIMFFFRGNDVGWDVLKKWFLYNGILAGLGAILALGHPLTIISALLAAPFTSLNPLIAAGWVSGLVEAIIRKPKVSDCHSLQNDVITIRGFYKNRITRVLLIVALTNLGSALGTWLAAGDILTDLWAPLMSLINGN